MGFTYGLAVLLVIFEGIIIQCEGAPKRLQNVTVLSDDVIESIISKTDFKTIHDAIRSYIVPANNIVMERILQNHIIVINQEFSDEIIEFYLEGDSFLMFGNYQRLGSFFERFGDHVKRIQVDLEEGSDIQSEKIIQNIFKKYAKKIEELRISTDDDDERFWKEILDGEHGITFPEVKKFQIKGQSNRNPLKLNLIFPKLEYFILIGDVADVNCFNNVKGLKELRLDTYLIRENQFEDIFKNNHNLTKIYLSNPEMAETMHSIAKHLKNLKTLEVGDPGANFLLRTNNNTVCNVPSVTQFGMNFQEMDEIFENANLSFDMPNLKKLTLDGRRTNGQIINFINRFEKLEMVELFMVKYDVVNCIEKLKHINEFTTDFDEDTFDFLKNIFERFDKESKLQTVKLIDFPETTFEDYEKDIKELNIKLKTSMKPTWKLSQGEQIQTRRNYMMFKREPFTCKYPKK